MQRIVSRFPIMTRRASWQRAARGALASMLGVGSSLALALTAGCLCGGGGESSALAGNQEGSGASVGADGASKLQGDRAALALLAQARASMREGRLDPTLRAQLIASDAPEHAAARAILGAIDHPEDFEAAINDSSKEGASATGGQEAAMVVVQPLSTPPEVGVPAVPIAADGGPIVVDSKRDRQANESSQGAPKPKGGGSVGGGSVGGGGGRDNGMAVITRGALSRRGKDVVLRLFAGGRVLFGTVDAAESRTVRVLARNSGALPSLLTSRPSLGGVKLTDVRKGIDSVQLTLELDEGWSLVRKGSFDDGAELVFRGP